MDARLAWPDTCAVLVGITEQNISLAEKWLLEHGGHPCGWLPVAAALEEACRVTQSADIHRHARVTLLDGCEQCPPDAPAAGRGVHRQLADEGASGMVAEGRNIGDDSPRRVPCVCRGGAGAAGPLEGGLVFAGTPSDADHQPGELVPGKWTVARDDETCFVQKSACSEAVTLRGVPYQLPPVVALPMVW